MNFAEVGVNPISLILLFSKYILFPFVDFKQTNNRGPHHCRMRRPSSALVMAVNQNAAIDVVFGA